ncbi:MAG: NAD-dependent protein deacylase [Oscillospiraceae bacterium]
MREEASLQAIIEESNDIVFFGGAGVSTESGIPDFRSVEGLYSQKYQYPPEVILSHRFYLSNPADFFDFYKDKMLCLNAKPNAAHYKLSEMEKIGKLKAVITQNIDGLHQAAGSENVLELHGSVHRNYCEHCHKLFSGKDILEGAKIPTCGCGGIIKPDVVLYGENLDNVTMQKSIDAIKKADVLIVGGTSLAVYPAAGLLDYYSGNKLVLINKSTTPLDRRADLLIAGNIGEVFSKINL